MAGPIPRFPGELLWRLSRDRLGCLTDWAHRYGDFVEYTVAGMRFFLLSDPDAIADVVITQADAFTKGPALRKSKVVLGEGLLTSEGDFHRRQRRLAQPALHPRQVATYAPLIVDYASRTCDGWRDGQRIDLHAEMMRLVLLIVGKTLFGAEVDDEVEEIGEAMDIAVRMFTRTLSPAGMLLNQLPLPSNFRIRRAVRRLHQTIDRFIGQRRAAESGAPPQRMDLLSLLLRARDVEADPIGMSDAQLRDECLTLFTAGHETTANALTFTFYLLAAHPKVAARLEEELQSVLRGRPPAYDDIERLAFTGAVLSESMRLYPPAWAIARQAVRAVTVAGRPIPAGGVVLSSQWVVHRDPRWWPEPERFKPERWLTPDPSRPRWAYFPFGAGPRQCIGESFAWTEAILATATIAQRWRIEVDDPRPPRLLATITLRPKGKVGARVREREARREERIGTEARREERTGTIA